MKKCVAYCRVSTNKDEQINSLDNQKSYFNRKNDNNKECELIKIYADEGLTGTKLYNRPEFNKMIYDAGIDIIETYTNHHDKRLKKRHVLYEVSERISAFSEIWIKNTSRFARNTMSYDIITKLREKGVHIRFIEQNICTADMGTDFMLKLFQLFDEQDSRDKSSKVRTGQLEGANKGKINTSSRLYGYKYNQPENRLNIIECEATIIRKIFDLYSKGIGIRRIINQLTNSHTFTRGCKPFGKTTISRILENEKYAGINARMKYDTGMVFNKNSYAKVKPKSEWLIKDTDKIPAIISKELFEQCQEIRAGRINYQNQKGVYKGTTDYAGEISCGICGASYNSNSDRGRRFYICATKKSKGTAVCNAKNLSLKALEEILTPEVYYGIKQMAIHAGRAGLDSIRKTLVEQLKDTPIHKIKKFKDRISEIEDEEDMLIKAYMKHMITPEQFERIKLPLTNERENLSVQLQAITAPKAETENKIAEIDVALTRLDDMVVLENTPKDDIIADIEKIIVMPNNTLHVKFKQFVDETKVKTDEIFVKLKYQD